MYRLLVVFVAVVAATSAFRLRSDLSPNSLDVTDSVAGGGRIANGKDAEPGQFPYQVGLTIRRGLLSTSWCGASLIATNWVLTAAHCTEGARSVTVILGATVRNVPDVKFTVNKDAIIVHEDWNTDTLKNDISLIKIPSVVYNKYIQPVKLPKLASSYSNYAGDYAVASGWGLRGDAAAGIAQHLQWTRLQVAPNKVCRRFYSDWTLDNICIKTPNRSSTCQGDSGGPLVLESSGVQIGLTSFGSIAGCEKGHPIAFTRLTNYLDWIQSHTGISV